jgi:transaldolase / glucose-6-phosphate isomerase
MPIIIHMTTSLQGYGQSIWLDFISRKMIATGQLARLVADEDVVGVTSNPTIFEKAIDGSNEYAAQIEEIRREALELPSRQVYERLIAKDIRDTADVLRPVFDRTRGGDGYVSVEVSPTVADDTDATLSEARHLWEVIARPNLMIKVPGTAAGVPAVRSLIADGINVNITLLFGREMYEAVASAYIEGLEDRAGRSGADGNGNVRIDGIASVASFFVSRIDTSVDALLDKKMESATGAERQRLERLHGKTAIANARLAYQSYKRIFAGPRWEALAAKGARKQRLLWASTSVKNPRYRDVMYVEELIGAETIDTMPIETLRAFREHGKARPSLESDIDQAKATLAELEATGVSLRAVTDDLIVDGIKKFQEPYDKMIASLAIR